MTYLPAKLADLERRYNGPVPAHELETALADPAAAQIARFEGRARYHRRAAVNALHDLRARPKGHGLHNLTYHFTAFRTWNGAAWSLKRHQEAVTIMMGRAVA